MNIADNISFNNFCQLCSKISAAARDKKGEILHKFIERWKKKAEDIKKATPDMNDSFFPVLRFLLPQLDRERGAYGVKEHTLAKIYIKILCLPKEGREANKLLEYRAPKSAGNQAGDFAEIAYWILKSRCSTGGELSIEDVNGHLDAIAEKHAASDPRGVDAELVSLLKATSADEQKWLIRILLKDMKLGMGQNKILSVYHPDARDLYDVSNNLYKICATLKDPNVRLHEVEIELFSPFRPMLSEECDVKKVDVHLKKSPHYYIETKLDGERFQLHMDKGNYKYFSRNGHDYTSTYGSNRLEGVLTPHIANQLKSDVESLILDGEMMGWNTKTKHFVTKAMNLDVKFLKEGGLIRPCFCVFDILHLNGEVLTNKPLECRIEILNNIITPHDGFINFVNRKRVSSKDEILESLNDAIDDREEGIVMKDFISVYKPNVRKNGGWYKLKPEYTDGLMDEVDVLILGGYFGGGRHRGNVSHFLVGVAVPSDDEVEPKIFHSMARVGSGYTMEELLELQCKLESHWHKTKLGEIPKEIIWTKEKPDVWIEPRKSFILQVKAAEIVPSDQYKTGYTLRFPRVEKVRYDKSWTDCITTLEFEEKRKNASGKLYARYVEEDSVTPAVKTRTSPRFAPQLGSQYKATDISKVETASHLLSGKEFCVISGGSLKKSDVEKKIAEYGGTLVQNPGCNTFCVLAEELTIRVKNIIQCKTHDVVQTSWLVSNLTSEATEIPDLTPECLLGMSETTSDVMSTMYDEFGDHYTVPSTREGIQHALKMAEKEAKKRELTLDEKYQLDLELFSGPSPYSLFRLCIAYFDQFPIINDPSSGTLTDLEIPKTDFQFSAGKLVDIISDEVTHVVVFSRDLSRFEEIQRINRVNDRKFHIVTEEWIETCWRRKLLLDEKEFYPKLS